MKGSSSNHSRHFQQKFFTIYLIESFNLKHKFCEEKFLKRVHKVE